MSSEVLWKKKKTSKDILSMFYVAIVILPSKYLTERRLLASKKIENTKNKLQQINWIFAEIKRLKNLFFIVYKRTYRTVGFQREVEGWFLPLIWGFYFLRILIVCFIVSKKDLVLNKRI